jgi:ADP-heptose:LPS heptosyltransferase
VPEPGVERIAVLRANALGDYIFALPALDALRASYPEAELTLLGRPWHAEFLADRPGPIDRVVVVPPSRGVRDEPEGSASDDELDDFFARMRGERFDIALQMHGGGRWSNPFLKRLGARLTAGCRAEDAVALDHWIRYFYFQPEITRLVEVASLVRAPPVGIEPSIAVLEQDVREAARFTSGGAFAVLHPGATAARRRWSPERFGAVGDALAAQGLRVIVTGTAVEQPVVDAVRSSMSAAAEDACGELSLAGLTGLLAAAAVVVTNDSGPLHLANAVGAPTVGIFWIGNVINGAPLMRARHRPIASFRVHCPVCGMVNVDRACEHDASFVDDVEIQAVLDAALDLLAARRLRAPS